MSTLFAPQGKLFQEASNVQRELHQWFTPSWEAEAIVEQEFARLRSGHRVLEPSCGDGACLCALPEHVDALGVEIDPHQAEKARRNSGREVIVGNFLEVAPEAIGELADGPRRREMGVNYHVRSIGSVPVHGPNLAHPESRPRRGALPTRTVTSSPPSAAALRQQMRVLPHTCSRWPVHQLRLASIAAALIVRSPDGRSRHHR